MIELRQPLIQGNEKEQLAQIKSYLIQFRDELQYAFNSMDGATSSGGTQAGTSIPAYGVGGTSHQPSSTVGVQDAQKIFDSVKAFIINSAEIVESYAEQIDDILDLNEKFVAVGPYGQFVEETNSKLSANAQSIDINHTNIQQVRATYGEGGSKEDGTAYAEVIKQDGYIKLGFLGALEGGEKEYGLEIGLKKETEDKQFSRYTDSRVVIYDNNGREGAVLSDSQLQTHSLKASERLFVGNFEDAVETGGNVVTRWMPPEKEE